MRAPKRSSSFRLSDGDYVALARITTLTGLSQAAAIGLGLRLLGRLTDDEVIRLAAKKARKSAPTP